MKKVDNKKKKNIKSIILISLIIISLVTLIIIYENSKIISYKNFPDTTWCGKVCEIKDKNIATIKKTYSFNKINFIIKPINAGKTELKCYNECTYFEDKKLIEETKTDEEIFEIKVNKLFKIVTKKKIK